MLIEEIPLQMRYWQQLMSTETGFHLRIFVLIGRTSTLDTVNETMNKFSRDNRAEMLG